MSSSHDENRRAELNGTEPAGEELAPAMAQHDAINDPGPSFLEYDRPTVRLAELPAWLQRFAASAGDPEDESLEADEINESENITQLPTASIEPSTDNDAEVSGIDLPSWLDDEESETSEPAVEPVLPDMTSLSDEPAPGTPQFMLSEDDLPDWLRSISPNESGDEGAAAVASTQSMAVAGLASVPSVARAWVTRDDMDALSEGGSLFALVASQSSSTQTQVATAPPTTPQPVTEPRRRRGRGDERAAVADTSATVVAEAPTDQDAPSEIATEEQATERNFKLLPVLIGSLLVVVIVLLAINFVL